MVNARTFNRLLGCPPDAPVFRYLEQTGTDSCIFTWRLERERDTATLSVVQRQGSETFLSRNTAAGETLAWQYVHQPDTDVRAEREDDRIRLSGRFQGKTVDEVHAIDDRPWFQPLSFSLQRMLARNLDQAAFWTIRPDTLEVLAMQAADTKQFTRGHHHVFSQQALEHLAHVDRPGAAQPAFADR